MAPNFWSNQDEELRPLTRDQDEKTADFSTSSKFVEILGRLFLTSGKKTKKRQSKHETQTEIFCEFLAWHLLQITTARGFIALRNAIIIAPMPGWGKFFGVDLCFVLYRYVRIGCFQFHGGGLCRRDPCVDSICNLKGKASSTFVWTWLIEVPEDIYKFSCYFPLNRNFL